MHKNTCSNTIAISIKVHQNIEVPQLDISLILDDQVFVVDTTKTLNEFTFEYDATKISQHRFEFKVSGKQQHLKKFYVDFANNITTPDIPSLACIIDRIEFDGHDIAPLLAHTARYHHNTNGGTELTSEEYTNWIGYDGSIISNFLTPLSVWFVVDYKF